MFCRHNYSQPVKVPSIEYCDIQLQNIIFDMFPQFKIKNRNKFWCRQFNQKINNLHLIVHLTTVRFVSHLWILQQPFLETKYFYDTNICWYKHRAAFLIFSFRAGIKINKEWKGKLKMRKCFVAAGNFILLLQS